MNIDKENKTITITRNTGITISASLIIMMAGALISATITFQNLRNQINANTTLAVSNEARLDKLETDNTDAKVLFAKIQTQLQSIDSNLVDIKAQLKD